MGEGEPARGLLCPGCVKALKPSLESRRMLRRRMLRLIDGTQMLVLRILSPARTEWTQVLVCLEQKASV